MSQALPGIWASMFAAAVLLFAPPAGAIEVTTNGAVVFDFKGFEDASLGEAPLDPPVGAVVHAGANIWVAPGYGGQYARIFRTSESGAAGRSRLIGGLSAAASGDDVVHIELRAYIPEASDLGLNLFSIRLRETETGSGAAEAVIWTDGNGRVQYTDAVGGTQTSAVGYAYDTWQTWTLEVDLGAGSATFSVGGVPGETFTPSNLNAGSQLNYFWVGNGAANQTTAFYLDGPAVAPKPRPADFGRQWVRKNPFTLGGWAVLVPHNQGFSTVDPQMFGPLGLNTLVTAQHTSTLPPHAAAGYSYHLNLNARDGLTDEVKQKAYEVSSTHPHATGWYIFDEPTAAEVPAMGEVAAWLRQEFPTMLIYGNLLPNMTSDFIQNYIDTVRPDVLIYDQYPFAQGSSGFHDRNEFFRNLTRHRDAGLANGIPYFTYLQTYDEFNLRYASESEIRAEAYAFLAAGYQGLYYYRYAGASGLVTGKTAKGPMYDDVAALNPEIAVLGNTLRFTTSTDLRFVPGQVGNPTPQGLSNWSAGAGGDTHITAIQVMEGGTNKDGLIGFFTDDHGEKYFMLTNLYAGSTMDAEDAALTFRVTFDSSVNSIWRLDRLTGEAQEIVLANHVLDWTLPGGTGDLFKYDNGNFVVPEPACVTIFGLGLLMARGVRPRPRSPRMTL